MQSASTQQVERKDVMIPLNVSHKTKDQYAEVNRKILERVQQLARNGWEPDEPITIEALRGGRFHAGGGRIEWRQAADDTNPLSLLSLNAWKRALKNEAVPYDVVSVTIRFKRTSQ